MKGYQFKLEALRRYRLFQEEAQQKVFAGIQRELDEARNMLEHFRQERRRTEDDMHRSQRDNATGSQMTVYVRYLQRLAREIAAQQSKVAGLEKKCEKARDELLEAMKKRKSLEKLKENGLKEYLAKLDAEELKFINEMAINRYLMKS